MLLMIDNYDSFTYNLVQYLGEFCDDIRVYRNDRIALDEIAGLRPQGIVISPGPCTPREAGISVEVARVFGPTVPMIGVCLGHQSIACAFGANIVRAPYLMHGKVSDIHHDGKGVFSGLPNPFVATRYHSLIVERETCPDCFTISAETQDGIIMGIRHKEHPIEGIQFHPESILTEVGKDLLRNFVDSIGS